MPADPVHILVVDDNREQRVALRALLGDIGEVVEAASGREALRQLLLRDFAVVLLDVQMPVMDGFETAALIRGRRRSEQTPIIFLTAHGDESHAARGYSLGAVDYMQAPYDPGVLRTKVAVFVDLFRKTAEVTRQAASLALHATQLRRLADGSLKIHAADSVEELLQLAADTALEVVEADAVAIEATIETHELARSAGARSIAIGRPAASGLHPGLRSLRDRFAGGPVRLSAVELATWFPPDPLVAGDDAAPPSLLAAPILGRDGRGIGWIQLTGRPGGEFTPDDEALLVQCARIVSLAVENVLMGQAREVNRAKDEFLATLSHELRTPLQAMLSWAEMLRAKDLDPETFARGLEVIERSARSQTQLIEGLLDISRIITGKLEIDAKPVDLDEVIEAALDAARPVAEAKWVALQRTGDGGPLWLLGDGQRLQQVMGNLLANAIKFTPAGGSAEVRLRASAGIAEIRVIDTGVGLSPEFLPHLFESFRQADSSSTRAHGGLGIGLAIARRLIELHGGQIRAESPGEGQGTTLVVRLPLHSAAQAQSAVEPSPWSGAGDSRDRLDGVRVVLVDDQPEARDCVALALERRGARVVAVGSAAEAFAAIDGAPLVLLSDIAMPDEDGLALIRRVRASDASRGVRTPAAALSAYARPEERSRALAAGFDLHLAKPIDEDTLVRAVLSLASRSAPP
jgi:signal transduction histidine kinase